MERIRGKAVESWAVGFAGKLLFSLLFYPTKVEKKS
jgi:hypothetical protein